MLVFLCPSCGRFGAIKIPERVEDASCTYCGNNDIDFISRPKLSKLPKEIKKSDQAILRAEAKVLELLDRAYNVYDDVNKDKKEIIEELTKLNLI